MKASASRALFLASLVPCLAGACASPARMPAMPRWTPDAAELVASAPVSAGLYAAALDDQDQMRVPGPTRDEVEDIWPARGLYVGGALVSSQPLGDFDGDNVLVGSTDLILIPDLDVGAGGAVYVSYRWYMNEIVVQYSITEHDGDFPGSPQEHDTTFYDLDINWRHYFFPKSPMQPYALLGLGWGRATIDNGSTDQATGTIFEDAELEDGINVNVGAGLALYTLPWVMFYGQAMYRFVRYESSDGIDGSFSNIGDVDGDGWNVQAGAAIRLLPGRKTRHMPKQ